MIYLPNKMSSAPPPAPRKRRPAEEPGPAPENPRTRQESATHAGRVLGVFEALTTWHMDSTDHRTRSMQPDGGGGEVWSDRAPPGHNAGLFRSIVNMANTSRSTRDLYEERRHVLRDASTDAFAFRAGAPGPRAKYEDDVDTRDTTPMHLLDNPSNRRSRAMLAQMQARDAQGRWTVDGGAN